MKSSPQFWDITKTLKGEEVFHRKYRTREEARMSVFEYIESFYNRQRKHISPDKFERCKKPRWLNVLST